ncbi:MAG: Bax inhibitor-1 family protein [Acutalibacteraceae bacterium]|nr:Bax inhibitor-1 family protein [Acutalibacteraceae bacterium]
MSKLFKYFAISLLFMLLGFTTGVLFIPAALIAIANVIMMVAVIGLLLFTLIMKRKRKSTLPKFSMNWVYLFAFIEGALLYPTLIYYLASLGVVLFLNIILGTLAIFLILSYIASKQPAGRYMKLGSTLYAALLVLFIVSIINLFLQVDLLGLLLSIAGIIIFSVYILFDVNQFKVVYNAGMIRERDDYSIFVLNIYLDFINLLLDILDIVDRIKN